MKIMGWWEKNRGKSAGFLPMWKIFIISPGWENRVSNGENGKIHCLFVKSNKNRP